MESIQKKFSLDFLPGSTTDTSRESSQQTKSSLDEARDFIYSSGIGNHLIKAEEQQMRLHDLGRAVKNDVQEFNFEDFWEAIKGLAARGVIKVGDLDEPSGNYTIKLSKAA